MEPGEPQAVAALVNAGVSRVVIGMPCLQGSAAGVAQRALRAGGVDVAVVTDLVPPGTRGADCTRSDALLGACLRAVLASNEALLHLAALGLPLGVLKYAMTLDGKIAARGGHAAWVSCPASRERVLAERAASDVVIVGGGTARRDDPRLTARTPGLRDPARLVMSRTLDLPEERSLWDVSQAPTIVATAQHARPDFQRRLRDRGVEVVEFEQLTPAAVAEWCAARGWRRCFWECGGTLAAPLLAQGVAHKLLAFVAPKIIGGVEAPTPVGELGHTLMTQALQLSEVHWEPSGADMLCTGYLPASGGLLELFLRWRDSGRN